MIWRVILIFASLCVAVGACYWLGDPTTAEVALMVSLMNHPFFSLSAIAIGLYDILTEVRALDKRGNAISCSPISLISY